MLAKMGNHMLHRIARAAVLAMLPVAFAANGQQAPALNPDHPTVYVVKRGDTLWDISEAFLVEPWRWPEIWEVNPQVENPHLIFPGDELALFYRDGQPRIRLRRAGETAAGPGEEVTRIQTGPRDVKLTPRVRVLPRDDAIPTIPVDAIAQFLAHPLVLTDGEFEAAPYVVSVGSESLVASAGRKVYVRGLVPEDGVRFGVYRRGQVYRNPDDESQILGYEALKVADGVVEAGGDPSTVVLITSSREVLIGDRLFPARDDQIVTNFHPRAPDLELDGRIISVVDGVTQIGENQIVVLDLGTHDGLQRGHVMAVYQRGETVVDQVVEVPPRYDRWWLAPVDESQRPRGLRGFPQALDDFVVATDDGLSEFVGQFLPGEEDPWVPGLTKHEVVTLPDQRAGTVLVFRPFERVSYALVMQATRAMHVLDVVKTP